MSDIDLNEMATGGRPTGFVPQNRLNFVQMTRDCKVGDRVCSEGDVIAVDYSWDKRPHTIMPVMVTLTPQKAQAMVDGGRWPYIKPVARRHPGPATVTLGHSLIEPWKLFEQSADKTVEKQAMNNQKKAERATSAPQRGNF
jgi:hypothetical protein